MMEDLIQVEENQLVEFEDEPGGEEEVEIPDLDPFVPPAGHGEQIDQNQEAQNAQELVPYDEMEFTESSSASTRTGDPTVTDGPIGIVAGVLFVAAGWLIIRLL
jgi:hypothetical protein